jgi:hypothetical protein
MTVVIHYAFVQVAWGRESITLRTLMAAYEFGG